MGLGLAMCIKMCGIVLILISVIFYLSSLFVCCEFVTQCACLIPIIEVRVKPYKKIVDFV